MVTGATGYVGGLVVERLLQEGWRVSVLVRHASKLEQHTWADQVRVVEGDASSRDDLGRAMEGAETAWFLIHSMGEGKDFAEHEQEIARAFADAAVRAQVKRIVYLGGLHPQGEELSEHLASRVAVGETLMASGVPTAAVQAGVLLGQGSSSFELLRTLTERLPGAFGPSWLRNRIQPIHADDAVHYLVRAADLDPSHNRTFDIGGPDALSYAEMMQRYAKALNLGPRPVLTLPVMTPGLAAQWIAMVSNMPAPMAKPLIGSLLHDTVMHEHDLDDLVGGPEGGPKGFEDAVRAAAADSHPWRFAQVLGLTGAAALAACVAGVLATDPESTWYRCERKPSWQPPGWLFGPVWTVLYTDIAAMTALHLTDAIEAEDRETVTRDSAALGVNLALNAAWSWVYFRFHRRTTATAVAAALAASSADLVRRVGVRRQRGVILSPYAAWTSFATALTDDLRRRNKRR